MLDFLRKLFSNGPAQPRRKANIFISSASESRERIQRLGLGKASETVPGILDVTSLKLPDWALTAPVGPSEEREYKPDPECEWVLEASWEGKGFFSRDELYKIFDKEWRMSVTGVDLYGKSATNNRWMYCMTGEAPERFERLEIAISLLRGDESEESEAALLQRLEGYAAGIAGRLQRVYGRRVRVAPMEPLEAALQRAVRLRALIKELKKDVLFVLKSDSFFIGMMAWDALQCIGLQWGDGDLFHWNNPNREMGDDNFFSVWTMTSPGYFFPEGIRAGKHNPEDLVFGFWIGRNTDPLGVFDAMIKAAEFCRQRLGGQLLDGNGNPLDAMKERAAVVAHVDVMRRAGIEPGSRRALLMFQ